MVSFYKVTVKIDEDNRNGSFGFSKGRLRVLNRGDRLIEVKLTISKEDNFWDFDN